MDVFFFVLLCFCVMFVCFALVKTNSNYVEMDIIDGEGSLKRESKGFVEALILSLST